LNQSGRSICIVYSRDVPLAGALGREGFMLML
jgi:hypothetical protein